MSLLTIVSRYISFHGVTYRYMKLSWRTLADVDAGPMLVLPIAICAGMHGQLFQICFKSENAFAFLTQNLDLLV